MVGEGSPPRNLEREARENLERLRENPYPGRGIILGHSGQGDIVQVYWLMGRSPNSRNRVLAQEGNIVKTDLFDRTNAGDTSLIIYNAMIVEKNVHIVSNGDQTDTIASFIGKNPLEGFEEALHTRTFEPDDPNFTPRISGASYVFRTSDAIGVVSQALNELSIIRRSQNGNPIRSFFRPKKILGIGHCIQTYKGDGNPLPAFDGEPYPIPFSETIDEIADTYWGALDIDNKVSLAVKTIHTRTGEVDYRIRNKLPVSSA